MAPYVGLILQLHNERRNQIAGGGLPPYPAAVQMASMQWNPELSNLAQFNAVRCRIQHDECHNTNSFRFAGQNLYILSTRNINIEVFLRQSIAAFFDEYRDALRADIDRFTTLERNGRQIGHFTAMVNERNSHIGCAISQFTDARNAQATYLVCNYAVTNMLNNPVYRAGDVGSQCRSGRDTTYRNLCSVREVYNYNQ